MEHKIDAPFAMDASSTMSSVSAHRLVKVYSTTPYTFQYAGADEKTPLGKTDNPLTATEVTDGFTSVGIQPYTSGQILWLEASEAIAIHQPFKAAANGKIQNIVTNPTPAAQFGLGRTLEASTDDADIILCFIFPSENYVK